MDDKAKGADKKSRNAQGAIFPAIREFIPYLP
jgi:hypothetical protein